MITPGCENRQWTFTLLKHPGESQGHGGLIQPFDLLFAFRASVSAVGLPSLLRLIAPEARDPAAFHQNKSV